MTHWMCVNCGYYLQATQPLERCPSCNQACAFNDVTCYRPDCGGEQNIDPLLVGAAVGTLKPSRVISPKSVPVIPGNSAPVTEILHGLTEKQKAEVRALGQIRTYEQNTVICRVGEKSPKLYLIEEGQATVVSEIGDGTSIPLTTVSSGQAFGWSVMVPPYILTATVVASTRVKVMEFEQGPLMSLIQSDPDLGLIIMQNVASIIALRLRNAELEMVGLIKQYRKK